jgi:hypothetical protein
MAKKKAAPEFNDKTKKTSKKPAPEKKDTYKPGGSWCGTFRKNGGKGPDPFRDERW